jgi:hypothetical protein
MKKMSDLVKAILETWLPTTWSRLTAGASISSAIGAFFLPEFLRLLYIQISDRITLLIRIGMPLLVLLSGTFLVLLIVVQHYKTLRSQKQPPSPMPQPVTKPAVLPKEQVDILILLSRQGELFTFQVTKLLDISEAITKYHLQELRKKQFVMELTLPYRGLPGQHSWTINDKGTKYLIENKLIS